MLVKLHQVSRIIVRLLSIAAFILEIKFDVIRLDLGPIIEEDFYLSQSGRIYSEVWFIIYKSLFCFIAVQFYNNLLPHTVSKTETLVLGCDWHWGPVCECVWLTTALHCKGHVARRHVPQTGRPPRRPSSPDPAAPSAEAEPWGRWLSVCRLPIGSPLCRRFRFRRFIF